MNLQTTLFSFLVCCLLSCFACQSEDSDSPFDPNLGVAPTNPNEQILTNLINDIRAAGETCTGVNFAAVNGLTFNETLNQVARNHADYMNDLDELTHIGADNSTVGDRLEVAGYNFSVAAENLAKGFADEESVVDAWQNSSGHCENIMNPDVTEMGVGTAGDYWVMVFAHQ